MAIRTKSSFSHAWTLLRTPIPAAYKGHLAVGWLILVLLLVQVVTGILLSFYYRPTPEMASESVRYIMRDVDWGWVVRGIHHWAAQVMILLALFQLLKVFFTGAYRAGRGAIWCLGLVLLLLIMAMTYTGSLLPWDNQAYWTVDVVSREIEALPLAGPTLAQFTRRGDEVTYATLSRLHTSHVHILPWLTVIVVLVTLWLLRRTGVERREAE